MRAREVTPLAQLLAKRIRESGPITFAEYMDACLYHPQHGYYSRLEQQPRRDYITSVDVSPIFGRLLLRQFHEMWELMDRPAQFCLVEAGAGTGALAKTILDSAADSFPAFYSALSYVAVERSEARRSVHRALLTHHVNQGRFESCDKLSEQIQAGCIFSNELFDALPVHRVAQMRGELFEIRVAFGSERGFHEATGRLSTPRIEQYFAEQGITLHEEQQAEVNLAASDWIEDAGKRLQRGFVLTIDYGRLAAELYDERHMQGTLLAYEGHRVTEDYFRAPGEQDLTAHVNFTALDVAGRRADLVPIGFTSQTNFLLSLARHSNFEDIELPDASESERVRARLLFKTLIHPEGMGETFQVFAQQKAMAGAELSGFKPL